MSQTPKKYTLMEMRVENFKRIVLVNITPTGAVTALVGKNGAGKTSALDALEAAMAGGRHCPDMPIRSGQTEGRIVVDLGEIIVERRFREGKEDVLEVRNRDGAKFSSPQKVLDSLMGKLSFDPLEFDRLEKKKQAETLANLVGLNLDQFATRRAAAAEERKLLKRQADAAHAEFIRFIVPDEATPVEEINMDDLLKELNEAEGVNSVKRDLESQVINIQAKFNAAVTSADREAETPKSLAAERDAKIKDLETMIEQIRKNYATKIESANAYLGKKLDELSNLRTELADIKVKASAAPTADTTSIKESIQQASNANKLVQAKIAYKNKQMYVDSLQARIEEANEKVKAIDAERIDVVAKAELPVPGLSLGEDGVLLNGIPFVQCSAAEKLRVSVAIALRLNPTLRIMLVRDGSLLDEDSMALLAELAEANDAQILIERVAADGEVGIWITDGMTEDAQAELDAAAKKLTETPPLSA